MTDKKRRIILDVNQHTFELLEALVVGMAREELPDQEQYSKRIDEMYSDKKEDFGPGVTLFLNDIANQLSAGVFRRGCWERGCLESLTGWQGTFIPDSLGPLAKAEYQRWDKLYKRIENKNNE